MKKAIIALGGNQGPVRENLQRVLMALPELGIEPVVVGGLYLTEPVGYTEQDWFYNSAALVQTELSPEELLARLLQLETELGRVRQLRWGPRTIDLDLIWYEGEERQTDFLQLPHPRAEERAFVVLPIADFWPDFRLGTCTVTELGKALVKSQKIKKITNYPW
ncbi:2-amino-4-hydroxy-6-hydroxymethyldihydropteridine diphosphokinase [Carboxydocella thermautotrophica]|nr:2-amino-4-hydroxy-6-hydroxymethyldihydropteridine diphosphokinase [Carboxydocella thermautotrophica]